MKEDFENSIYLELRNFLKSEYSNCKIYPEMNDIFNSLKFTPYENVKVVILGQDPYYNPNQAHGLCFSVKPQMPAPRSLVNIFQEIKDDVGVNNKCPCLTNWAKQGVLLLNTVLTVRAGQPNSHKGKGWEFITDEIIKKLNASKSPIVFLFWGGNARAKKDLIQNPKHLILECPHPSPLSAYAGFFGCKHFSKANEFLKRNGIEPINWSTDSSEEKL